MDGSEEQNKPQTEETPSISEAVGLPTQSAPPKKSPPKIFFILGVAILITAAVGGTVYLVKTGKLPPQKESVACTLDAKICPEGSYVSRIPPKCEFAPCPGGRDAALTRDPTANWKTYTSINYTFKYPANLDIKTDDERVDFIDVRVNKQTTTGRISHPTILRIDKAASNEFSKDYENTFRAYKSSLVNVEISKITNGIKVSGEMGEGFGEGTPEKFAVMRSGQISIVIRFFGSDKYDELFDQILSTFKFLD